MPSSSISEYLKLLVDFPNKFTPEHAFECINTIMKGECTPAQTAAFLTALKLSQKEKSPEIVSIIAKTLRNHSLTLTSQLKNNPKINEHTVISKNGNCNFMVDIVGTGGDGQNTFNVSTASGIVVAGCGLTVAKHGNRASSSSCGSGDVLEALGAKIIDFSPEKVSAFLSSSSSNTITDATPNSTHEPGKFCFLYSQNFHPAMKHVAATRKELGFRTIFNILGPLINPAKPNRIIIGVSTFELGRLMAETLLLDGIEFAWVVHGKIGLDEISPEGQTDVWELKNGTVKEFTVSPSDFGLQEHPLVSVKGGDAKENSEMMRQLLNGQFKDSHPILDFVCLNSAALLFVAEMANSLKEGVSMAKHSINSGKALISLVNFVKATC